MEVVEQEEWAGRFRSRLPVTVPVRFVWSQREMNCINGECVLHQVQVRLQSQLNRTGPVQFISTVKTDRQRDLQGTVSAATSSVCFLQNIRCMNQTSYLQNSPLLHLCRHPIPAAPPSLLWLNFNIFPLLLDPLPASSPTARKRKALWRSLVTRVVHYKTAMIQRVLWLLDKKKHKKIYEFTVKKQLLFH